MATNAATSITFSSATLNATVNAKAADTTVSFEYGLTTAYGLTSTALPDPVTGTTDTLASADISGLTPGATYHYRAKGVSTAGTAYGDDMTFAAATPLILNAGSPLTYNVTETLTTSGGGGTGTVTYQITAGSCSISGGNLLKADSGTGTCTVMATKAADANYTAATVSATVTLQKAATTALNAGVSFTLTATVTSSAGTVTFKNGGVDIAGCVGVAVVSGSAVCSTTALPLGQHDITAGYSGNANYLASSSVVVRVSTLLGKMSRNSWYLSPEGWIVAAYTKPDAPNEVYLEVITTGNVLVNPSNIAGMTTNPKLIANNAVAPEVSLSYNMATRTAYVTYTSAAGRQVVAVPGIRQAP